MRFPSFLNTERHTIRYSGDEDKLENEQSSSTNEGLPPNPAVKSTRSSQPQRSDMSGRPPFDVFNLDSEDVESYLERLQEYFIAYDIKNDTDSAAKRRAILLISIGSRAYRVLKDLSFSDAPNTKTFDQFATLLRGHCKPTRLKMAERFHSATKKPGQSIVDFVRELERLAGTCEFTNEQR